MINKLKSVWFARFGMATALISLAGGGLTGPIDGWFIVHTLSGLVCGTSLFLNWNEKRRLTLKGKEQ